MDENIVEFEDYNVSIDLREIEKMNEEEILECEKLVNEIMEKLDK